MHITFLTRKSALTYRRGLRQRVVSLTLDCNGVFAIRAYGRSSCLSCLPRHKISDSGNRTGKTEPSTRFIGLVPGYPGTRHGPSVDLYGGMRMGILGEGC